MIETKNFIAGKTQAAGNSTLQSVNPATRSVLPEQFTVATQAEIDEACQEAHQAWRSYKHTSGKQRARFLRAIATEIEALGSTLVDRAMAESGLPQGRIEGERGRTCGQLRQFAAWVEEGSWVNAVIDEAMPDRKPLPRADLRKVAVAIGPVAVFTASNFPLAFSTAGGDTASALAAGCPVVVKAHPSHLGTHALVSGAIVQAARDTGMPTGVFSALTGGIEEGQRLVQHPLIKAVGFTGSFGGGTALFKLANQRDEPIPVYAEMGSVNPIFVLPSKVKEERALADTIAGSVNLGAGQFCTNPGLLVLQDGPHTQDFLAALEGAFQELQQATMLNEGIYRSFEKNKEQSTTSHGVESLFQAELSGQDWKGAPACARVKASDFLKNRDLQEEVFGPYTLAVICADKAEMIQVAEQLQGQLTATVMGSDAELTQAITLVDRLGDRVGRVLFNGVPTGVEVCPAMHHGGPFPSSTFPQFTSVGMDAIQRFVRPLTFQNAPEALLPDALKAGNPLGIWRTVNGKRTQA